MHGSGLSTLFPRFGGACVNVAESIRHGCHWQSARSEGSPARFLPSAQTRVAACVASPNSCSSF
jgi:hypothetical protein